MRWLLDFKSLRGIFLTYFRVIKTAQKSPLLPVVLQGIARWCHLLNVDFMFEIVGALLKLLQQGSLPLQSALYCAITAFQALRNAGDVFRIDLSAYYHFVYSRFMQLICLQQIAQSIFTIRSTMYKFGILIASLALGGCVTTTPAWDAP